jgi:hypothetical protein
MAAIGPVEIKTSDEVVRFLTERGQSQAAARRMLSRAAKNRQVWRSESCRLPGNRRLFARMDFAGTDDFFVAAAAKIAETERKGIARCLKALGEYGSLLHCSARRYLASPDVQNSERARYPTFGQDLNALYEFGVETQFLASGDPYLSSSRSDREVAATEALRDVSRRRVECMLSSILVDTFRRQNILSWNRYEKANPRKGYVLFNGNVFSGFRYCYLSPVVRQGEEGRSVGCPVLVDVVSGRCRQTHLDGYSERIRRATFRGQSQQRYLGIIAATDFEEDAWPEARNRKLWTINLRQMFGDPALDALAEIEKILQEIDSGTLASDSRSSDSIVRLLEDLKGNPIVNTLRSISFEVVAALIITALGCEGVGMALDVPFEQTTRDVDVYGSRGDDLWIIECKANAAEKELDSEDVRKFFTQTVPAFVHHRRSSGMDTHFDRVVAEIWTTGSVGSAALNELEQANLAVNVQAGIMNQQEVVERTPANRHLRRRVHELLTAIAMPISSETGAPHCPR